MIFPLVKLFCDNKEKRMRVEMEREGEGKNPIEGVIGDELRKGGLSLGTAESCTGGLLSHRITNVSGSSDYYKGGIVAYSNEVKQKILHVAEKTLEEKGAVSAACAREMSSGVINLLDADIGIATTGIAGPTGGTPDKPVGLVYIALATNKYVYHEKYIFQGDRGENKREAVDAALEMLKASLKRARSSER